MIGKTHSSSANPLVDAEGKSTRIDLFNFKSIQMRAFHMSWLAFFFCFFAWFGLAPLMPVIREDLGLTQEQVGNTIVASVLFTIVARVFVGWLCDRVGPRISYSILLILCSIPVMGVGLSQSYESFIIFRLLIGAVGASFVITQYHTTMMFSSNCVGTANATVAGWGNTGGGVTQIAMPLIFAAFVAIGLSQSASWRLAMVIAGAVCFFLGIAYFFLTKDTPAGNFSEIKKKSVEKKTNVPFFEVANDRRVWILFVVYAVCFGIEITINGIAALYFTDYFGLGLKTAGIVAGTFGLMNLFARSLGGIVADRVGGKHGLQGRVYWLFIAVVFEGIALIIFSRMDVLPLAVVSMVLFSLFVQMSEGATYSIVPFINKKAVGMVSGIVAAGGNAGAVFAGMMFRSKEMSWPDVLFIIGVFVLVSSLLVPFIRFKEVRNERLVIDKYLLALRLLIQQGVRSIQSLFQPIDFFRIFLGAALIIKGAYFISNTQTLEVHLGSLEIQSILISRYVLFAHIVGGSCLLIGLATRLASFLNIPIVASALFLIHLPDGLFSNTQGVELTAITLMSLLLFLLSGGGRFSIDAWLKNKTIV